MKLINNKTTEVVKQSRMLQPQEGSQMVNRLMSQSASRWAEIKHQPLSLLAGLLMLTSALLSGCGGGAGTESNTTTAAVILTSYTGPAAETTDIRNFETAFWNNLRASNRCGSCHDPDVSSAQAPYFARNDDVNAAYRAIMDDSTPSNPVSLNSTAGSVPFVNRTQTNLSYFITKVRNHNCWLGPSEGSVCADIVNAYIDSWVGASGGGSTKTIQLTAPASIRDPGASKNYPDNDSVGVTNFTTLPSASTSLHGLLTTYCAGCHVSSSRTPQTPFFAESDATKAYEELKGTQKIDLDSPENSRIVVRLREESHNCWTPADCDSDAQALEDAVTAFAQGLTATEVAADLKFSKALNLSDAIVASGGDRYESNAIALYEFKRGTGSIAYDTSGISPAMDLSLSGGVGDYSWVRGYGVEFKGVGKAQASVTNSRKLYNSIKDIGEYSIEAWVVPANVTQEGPAHILSYIGTSNNRNFTLGQTLYEYDFLNRSSLTIADGAPAASTENETLQATLQHVVITYDPVDGKKIYVNGALVKTDTTAVGTLVNWDSSFAFVLGNDQERANSWSGKLRLVAIHNRVLTPTQITQNFQVGVGAKFLMLFNVKEHTCPGNVNANECSDYVMFEVSEYDNYSYLFSKPTFIRLSSDPLSSAFDIRGMRIGINGKEVTVGQVYQNLSVTINTTDDINSGVLLSDLGTIVSSQKGSDGDEFFLTFEQLVATSAHDYTEAAPSAVLVNAAEAGLATNPTDSDIGVRTFDEINSAMVSMTGVDPFAGSAPNRLIDQYNTLQQQLPAVENIDGFLSAHQMGIAQLSIAYCDSLVEDSGLRTSFFGAGFDFNSGPDAAFGSGDSAAKNQIVNAFYNKMIGLPGSGTALLNAPTLATVKAELIGPAATNANNLYDRLYNGCASNIRLDSTPRSPLCVQDAARTRSMVKAMCASVLGSAAMLVQ
jgi:hypothetical protein